MCFPEVRFRRTLCTGCGTCAAVCPTGAASMEEGGPAFDRGSCISCGHCGAYCPVNAFGLEPLPAPAEACSPEGLEALLERRRSTRIFMTEPPSDGELERVLETVSSSPTGVNAQGLTVRVHRGEEEVRELLRPVASACRLLVRLRLTFLLGAYSRFARQLASGADPLFRGAPVVLFVFVPRRNPTGGEDGAIAASLMMLMAESIGLGTLWNGAARKLYPFFRRWHEGAPRGSSPKAVLCLGRRELPPRWSVPPRHVSLACGLGGGPYKRQRESERHSRGGGG